GGAAQGLGAVDGGRYLESGEAQSAFQRGKHVGVVVNDQDPRRGDTSVHVAHFAGWLPMAVGGHPSGREGERGLASGARSSPTITGGPGSSPGSRGPVARRESARTAAVRRCGSGVPGGAASRSGSA